MTNEVDLQEIFSKAFARNDLQGAKEWARKWNREMEQKLPGQEDSDIFTQRAMAGHISDYLQDFTGDEPDSYAGSNKIYLATLYGPDIYWYM